MNIGARTLNEAIDIVPRLETRRMWEPSAPIVYMWSHFSVGPVRWKIRSLPEAEKYASAF